MPNFSSEPNTVTPETGLQAITRVSIREVVRLGEMNDERLKNICFDCHAHILVLPLITTVLACGHEHLKNAIKKLLESDVDSYIC